MSHNYHFRRPAPDSNLRPDPGPRSSSDRHHASPAHNFYRLPPDSSSSAYPSSSSSSSSSSYNHSSSSSRGAQWSQDSALSILSSCGLEPSDLALLAKLPEDVLTVDSLPQVLKQIKQKRGAMKPLSAPSSSSSSAASSSSSYPHSSTHQPAVNTVPSDGGDSYRQLIQYPLDHLTASPLPPPSQERWGSPTTSLSARAQPQPPSAAASSSYMVDFHHRSQPAEYKVHQYPTPAPSQGFQQRTSGFDEMGRAPVFSQDYHNRPGLPQFGKTGRDVAPMSSHNQASFHSAGSGQHSRFGHAAAPSPEPTHPKPHGGRSAPQPRPSSQPDAPMPTKKEALDFHGTSPKVFPYSCSLCDITVMSEKVWVKHINGTNHADGQLSLLQRFPQWDCRMETINKQSNTSEKGKNESVPDSASQQANQNSAQQAKPKVDKKIPDKGKVVCVKFPPQAVDEAQLRKMVEPFGEVVKIVLFPSLAFVELGSISQANDLVKFHSICPPTVNGNQVQFEIAATFSFLQSSQVVSFTPAPTGQCGRADLISIIKRFGWPLYTLFLPSMVFVEMKNASEAKKLVEYYMSNTLKINSDIIKVSYSGEYKSLMNVPLAKKYEEEITQEVRSTSRDKEEKRKRSRTRSRSRERSRKGKRSRSRSRSKERSSTRRRTRSRSRSKEKSRKEKRNRSRSRSRSKSRERSSKGKRNRSRSRSRSKSTEKSSKGKRNRSRSRSRSKSRGKSGRDKRSRSKSRSIEKSSKGKRNRSRSKSTEKSSKEKRTRSRSRSKSRGRSSRDKRSRSRSREKTTAPKTTVKTEATEPETVPNPAAVMDIKPKVEPEEQAEEEAESSEEDSDIEGMQVIGEDVEELEDEDDTGEEENEEEEGKEEEQEEEAAEKDCLSADSAKPDEQEQEVKEGVLDDPEQQAEQEPEFPLDLENCITLDELREEQSDQQDKDVQDETQSLSGRVLKFSNLPRRILNDKEFVRLLRGFGTPVHAYHEAPSSGFIEMSSSSEAVKVVEELNSKPVTVRNTKLLVQMSDQYQTLTDGWPLKLDEDEEKRSNRRTRSSSRRLNKDECEETTESSDKTPERASPSKEGPEHPAAEGQESTSNKGPDEESASAQDLKPESTSMKGLDQEAASVTDPEQQPTTEEHPDQESEPKDDPVKESESKEDPEPQPKIDEDPDQESASMKDPNQESESKDDPDQESASMKGPNHESASKQDPEQESASMKGPNQESASKDDPDQESASMKGPNQESASKQDPVPQPKIDEDPDQESASMKDQENNGEESNSLEKSTSSRAKKKPPASRRSSKRCSKKNVGAKVNKSQTPQDGAGNETCQVTAELASSEEKVSAENETPEKISEPETNQDETLNRKETCENDSASEETGVKPDDAPEDRPGPEEPEKEESEEASSGPDLKESESPDQTDSKVPSGEAQDQVQEPAGAPEGDAELQQPTKPVGAEFVRPVVGYFCHLCQLIYTDEEEAKVKHCSTLAHYRKYQEKTGKDPWAS